MDAISTTKIALASNVIASTQFTSDFEGEVIRVIVRNSSSHSVSFQVHKHLLSQKSPYFTALPSFSEGTANEVTFEDMSPNAFRHLVHWFYRDSLDPRTNDPRILVETWIAADRLMMSRCKDVVMDQLRQQYRNQHSEATILEVVEPLGYSTDSPLLKYLTDQVAFDCIAKDDAEVTNLSGSDWPPLIQGSLAFILTRKIIETAQRWRKSRKFGSAEPVDPSGSELCIYHDHAEGEECYAKAKTGSMW